MNKSPKPQGKKSSSYYQRRYRERLREAGYTKKELWIHPINAQYLAPIEKALREPDFAERPIAREMLNMEQPPWTIPHLYEALKRESLFSEKRASVELVEGLDPALYIEMNEMGGLPLFISISGYQMLVETMLWPANRVKNPEAFNEALLRTHKYLPLSTVSLDATEEGDAYFLFGALSANSIIANVMLEIEVLADNAMQAAEAYAEHLAE